MADSHSESVGTLVLVWAALMGLLALTVGATFTPLGPLMPVVNLTIACMKTALIYWVFMHLRELGGVVRIAALGAFCWLSILLMITAADYLAR